MSILSVNAFNYSIFKVLVATYIHLITFIHTTQLSVAIRRGLSPSLHRFEAQWESFPVVPSQDSYSGLPYSKPTLYQLSNAAP
jgi:hypothetical protein